MTLSDFKRWLYRGQRPNWIARILNRAWAAVGSSGVAPNFLATLEVTGRKSGRTISLPVVVAIVDGQRYLVSMLGNNVQLGAKRACSGWKSSSSKRRPRRGSTRRSPRRPACAHLESLPTASTGSATTPARR